MVLFSAPVRMREWDSEYEYHQDSDFLYLKQKYPQLKLKKAATLITAMRVVKSPEELTVLQQVIDLTCASLREAIAKVKPGMYEYELEAMIEYGFKIFYSRHESRPRHRHA